MIKYIIGLSILGLVGCGNGAGQLENEKDGTVVNYEGLRYTVEKAECSMTQASSTSSIDIAKIEVLSQYKQMQLLYCDNSDPTGSCQNYFPSDGIDIRFEEINIDNVPYAYFTCIPGTEAVDTNLWWFISTQG